MSRQPRLPVMEYGPNVHKLTEKQLEREVWTNASRVYGWIRKYQAYDSRLTDRGFPDLTLLHPDHGLLFLELKGGTRSSYPSAEQVEWCRDLRHAGIHAYVVYPRDLQTIDALLRGEILPPYRDKVDTRVRHLIQNEEKTR